ncbi:MAG TPA: ATP-binding protein [Kofleriaceae bacterium]|nr:ATP-binding protein [Kofleriaceae bacterium]
MSESPAAAPGLVHPRAEQLLDGVTRLARDFHLDVDEARIVDLALQTLAELFPGRGFAVRVFDPRSPDRARTYATWELRPEVASERVVLKESSLEKTKLKSAVAASARLRFGGRWDSPFPGVAHGFAVPLVAAGELYGVLDVGYPLGADESAADEPDILPIANQLSVALRNERLHRETSVLRDYQTKLIEQANALILGVDRHWRITVCNQELCRVTGYHRDEVIGRDLRDWLPADQRTRLQKLFLQALGGGKPDTAVNVTLETKQGGRVRTVWSVAAISGGHHQVEAVVAIGQDQTRIESLQRQVIQAEKLATLGQLAAGVVHELNNPLTSITVYAEYLVRKAEQGGNDLAADAEKLRRIRDGAQRILQFARDLVQYASPAGDELDLIQLNGVVRQSLSFCEHLFERHGVSLVEELGEELPPLYAVPGQLEQVVINLVTNAVQAVGPGGGVTVRTFRAAADRVGLSVADDGPGIAPEDRQKIFEPFFTTKTDGKGTGLGLSIVANIIEQHEGSIAVDASTDGGAIFTITLPASR